MYTISLCIGSYCASEEAAMPLIILKTSVSIQKDRTTDILAAVSQIVSAATGKPEEYIMATVEHVDGIMAGQPGPVAFADVRGIGGLTKDVNGAVSSDLCKYLEKELGIPSDRIYITFSDVAASNWGWKGETFG